MYAGFPYPICMVLTIFVSANICTVTRTVGLSWPGLRISIIQRSLFCAGSKRMAFLLLVLTVVPASQKPPGPGNPIFQSLGFVVELIIKKFLAWYELS